MAFCARTWRLCGYRRQVLPGQPQPVEQPFHVDPKLRPDSASVIWPNDLVIAAAALFTKMSHRQARPHLLGHGLLFAAAAGVGGDLRARGSGLASCARDRPGSFVPAYPVCVREGARIDTLRTVGDSFWAAVSPSNNQGECVTRWSVLAAPWRRCYPCIS